MIPGSSPPPPCRLLLPYSPQVDAVIDTAGLDSAGAARSIHDALGCEPEVVIDAVGVAPTIQTGLSAAARGGRVALVGMGALDSVRLDLSPTNTREVDLMGVFRRAERSTACSAAALSTPPLSLPSRILRPAVTPFRFSFWKRREEVTTGPAAALIL